MINPDIQNYFDGEAFDPEQGYADLKKRDKKIRHIQLHIAKAAMKLATGDIRKIVEDVIPDAAIYRTQLINIIGTDSFLDNANNFPDESIHPNFEHLGENCALDKLVFASGSLATYIEHKEHGRPADEYDLTSAALDLHEAAIILGEEFDIDVDQAHIYRLESQLGRALPLEFN